MKTEFHNKSREFYNENEDVAVMMFDINHGYRRCSSIDLILSEGSCQKTQSAEKVGGGGYVINQLMKLLDPKKWDAWDFSMKWVIGGSHCPNPNYFCRLRLTTPQIYK